MTTIIRHLFTPTICFSLFLAAVCLLSGCASGPSLPSNAVQIGPSQNNSRVTLKPGQMLVIELERNPSTGYIWQLIAEVNQDVVLPDNTKTWQTSKQKSDEDNISEQYLRFVAQQPGETNIRLNYVQPGIGPSASAPTYTVHLVVK
jgi:predicted secreted protein